MKSRIKKILRWTSKVLFFLLGLVICIKLITSVLFIFMLNNNYREYRWKGGWKSIEKSYTSGHMVAQIPHSIPFNQTLNCDAVVFNHFYTIEHVFSSEKMKLTGYVFLNQPTANGVILNDHLSIGFQATLVGLTGRQIELTGSLNSSRTVISGSYRSLNPNDFGTFSLTRR